ncbi:MAG: zf-TFIIB domain-containing protein [Candidatus Hatepunaea meridiana]|nr:zf-TFIIB domain-containing protein [Candidatus Hatepunaea meridiana]
MDQLICPNCKSKMDKIKHPDITIDQCSNCGGTFLEKGELNSLATGMAGDIEFCSVDQEFHTDKHPYRSCPNPSCTGKTMRKINLLTCADTVFDYCDRCEGFFLDKGEIQQMNIELEQLTKGESAEEFREYIDGHLVRSDRIADVRTVRSGLYGQTSATPVDNLRISVYFKNSLNLGLRIYSEKWTYKFVKLIGLFQKQDIQVGNEKLDSLFIIQGSNEDEIKSLLSKYEIQNQLIEFKEKNFKIYNKRGTLEITDKRIIYTEGPYTGNVKYDVKENRIGVVTKMLNIANAFESNRVVVT